MDSHPPSGSSGQVAALRSSALARDVAAARDAFSPEPASVLYRADDALEAQVGVSDPEEFFHDLNLDPVIEAIIMGREEYDLDPLFRAPLVDLDAIAYRTEVMQDIERTATRRAIDVFAELFRTVRQRLLTAGKRPDRLEEQRWRLAAAEAYVDAVEGLARDLSGLELASRGLRAFRAYLIAYSEAGAFRALASQTRLLAAQLAAIRYCVLIHNRGVTVRPYAGEDDYSAAVEATFRKFQDGVVKDYRRQFKDPWEMNHVEALILERVALLNPGPFGALARFCAEHTSFVDPTVARFDREIQFYCAYLDHIDRFRAAGLAFCYPRLSNHDKSVSARGAFDLALAGSLMRAASPVVSNDFCLTGAERILVVTGPNQGGKTTFARMFGQMHYLARLGVPVPGSEASLFDCDRVLTHFEREEDLSTQRGKLEDDLVRIRDVLERATPKSIVIINEFFASTTLDDALLLGREVLRRLSDLDLLCVCVTFLDELSTLDEKTVSMVAGVDPVDPTRRTFRVERRAADGLAYALAIAEKHRVTARWLRERIRT